MSGLVWQGLGEDCLILESPHLGFPGAFFVWMGPSQGPTPAGLSEEARAIDP